MSCYKQKTAAYRSKAEPKVRIEAVPSPNTLVSQLPIAADTQQTDCNAAWKLDELWPTVCDHGHKASFFGAFRAYKQNYLLAINKIRNPAEAPSSPNPLNNVPATNVKSDEAKFQVSFKAPVLDWPWGDRFWFAYTQQSRWQVFSSGSSRPFRESNYEPELIFLSHRFATEPTVGPMTLRFFNLSYLHQSNGQSLPRSRSWNRITAQVGAEYDLDSKRKFAVLVRPWWRVPENRRSDDNPDIENFMGHGDLEINYWGESSMISALVRSRALQFDLSIPISEDSDAMQFHVQYFNGYGESLIDYNHKLHSLGKR